MRETAEYFTRNLGALTAEQQQGLLGASATVVGCGGLGGYVIEELARIGLGRLHCFDPDVFSPSNCNRQLNALLATLGRNKAEVAAERVAAIHPLCAAQAYPMDFRRAEGAKAFSTGVVIDCLDDVQARIDLAARCANRGLPLVHGAVNGWYGQVGVHLPGGDLIARLYPPRTTRRPTQPPSVLACTVALVASLQVAEAVKLLLGLESPLINTWLHIDLKEGEFQRID